MNHFIKSLLRKPYHVAKYLWRLNILATFWMNFKMLSLRQAIKFPIHCFGKIKFHNLSGHLIIDAPIKNGMIQIGYRWFDLWPTSYLPTQILFRGETIFQGECIISGGVYISSFTPTSVLKIGSNVTIGGGSLIKAIEKISIGSKTRITGNCTVLDSNMHYVKDIENGVFSRLTHPIKIANNCWINAGSVITKGAVLPPYSIVARNSFIGKDMSQYGECCMFAGSPAKLIKKGIQRIFNYLLEGKLTEYFNDNPNVNTYQDSPGLTEDQ